MYKTGIFLKEEVIPLLKSKFDIEKVILFGSHAYGKPDDNSDIDLVVILNERGLSKNYMEKLNQRQKVTQVLKNYRKKIPLDVLVYTREEWEKQLLNDNSFIRDIKTNGVNLV